MALHFHRPTPTIDDLTLQLKFDTPLGPARSGIRSTHMPAEWFPQSAVQLTWPHEGTDWAPALKEVTRCYVAMAAEIASRERLLVVTPHVEELRATLRERLPDAFLSRVSLYGMPTNDTWARDHGFITLLSAQGPLLLDFRFNGWGEKFPSELDNQICRRMMEQGALRGTYESHQDFVLEGGSIECDGRGTLLTTSRCLLAPRRNQPLTKEEIERSLLRSLRAERVLWLDHGALAGDDTDGHIDTLARFCPGDTIAYVRCDDPSDEHHSELRAMEDQLRSFRTAEGKPYRLIPLPMAAEERDGDGNRLPATYANFLVINGAVLLPTYGHPELDERARRQLQRAFPRRDVVGVDCRPLIAQRGSLHCSAMQFPVSTLS